ncbi:MAG: oligoribonuclease [Bradymonadaceae bacterium]|nr:oligoribonuclease [Lujinxingiaceae bacterium]
MASDKNLVWIDLEMSGLDPQTCVILEIATIMTDSNLEIIAEGPSLIVHQPDSILDNMDEWNTSHHGASGLTEGVRNSTISLAEAEQLTLQFVRKHSAPRTAPLCGNSIWQDRRFIHIYMPRLAEHFHYRNIDVSSIKELVRRWYPPEHACPPTKGQRHRALDDIRDSIDELKHYRASVFIAP